MYGNVVAAAALQFRIEVLHVPIVVARDVETVRSQRYRPNDSNWKVEALKETGRVNMANIHRKMLQKVTAGILNTTAKIAVYITTARESKVSHANGQIRRDLK